MAIPLSYALISVAPSWGQERIPMLKIHVTCFRILNIASRKIQDRKGRGSFYRAILPGADWQAYDAFRVLPITSALLPIRSAPAEATSCRYPDKRPKRGRTIAAGLGAHL